MILPDQFIPIFEHKGFCIHLDYYMVEQACKQFRAWMTPACPLSPSQSTRPSCCSMKRTIWSVSATTRRYEVPCRYITPEILEDEALIQSMGCNYGQGYYYSKPIPVKDFYHIFLKRA